VSLGLLERLQMAPSQSSTLNLAARSFQGQSTLITGYLARQERQTQLISVMAAAPGKVRAARREADI
jgi:hypothetical protein